MDSNTKAVMEECTRASDEERITFGKVVGKLIAAGVERYHTDLVRADKVYFLPDDSSHRVAAGTVVVAPARTFSADGVAAAIRAIQTGHIQYREFCRQIAASGCVGYHVSLAGRRAVYYGRTGETHVELFPRVA
jgi:uncharacterized protein YbcV (DUF1398 family)